MNVVLYGAGGRTGRLVAAALERRGIRTILAGRTRSKLEELSAAMRTRPDVRVAALDDRVALVRSLGGADVVVNCAGPYLDLGDGIIEAALESRCHYFDATGEADVIRAVYDRYDKDARRRDVMLCPAFAAKGALGDWGATTAAAGMRRPLDEVAVAYAHGVRTHFRPSTGSMLAAAGQRFFKQRDDYDPNRSVARHFQFPAPFGPGLGLLVPGAEDISIPEHLRVGAVRSYLSLAPGSVVNEPWARICLAWLQWIPLISQALRVSPAVLALALRDPPDEERIFEPFMAAIEVTAGDQTARLAIATPDPYGVTAEILAYGVSVLARNKPVAGVIPPSVMCDARTALRELVSGGVLRVQRWRG